MTIALSTPPLTHEEEDTPRTGDLEKGSSAHDSGLGAGVWHGKVRAPPMSLGGLSLAAC
jgi:hypothetical protein